MTIEEMQKYGGPAFPIVTPGGIHSFVATGMSLLDYFAGQVAAGLLADPTFRDKAKELAEKCYMAAEAMLAERERRQQCKSNESS